jgi:hypothetical protein
MSWRTPSGHASRQLRLVRQFEERTRADVRERRWLRLHVFLIGLLTLAACGLLSLLWMRLGVAHLGARFVLSLLGAYGVYLGLLYLWGRWLLSRDEGSADGFDLPIEDVADGMGHVIRSGGGGDFGGGGASGSFDLGLEGSSTAEAAVSGAAEVLGGADEGAVVAVPIALVVGAAVLLAVGLGFVVFGLFGVEIVLGVVVEIAFASVGGALAYKARREGWLMFAIRRTLLPMAGVLVCALLLGWALQTWLPQAATLPQALRLLFG